MPFIPNKCHIMLLSPGHPEKFSDTQRSKEHPASQPGTNRVGQGHKPGTARDSQRQPWRAATARDSQGHPGTARDSQGEPGKAKGSNGHQGQVWNDLHYKKPCS